ncbi:DUF3299 domain-containing protein [Maricaulis sp.]|uniref:DUF3299 domain-containing protein n=1 Tax=Maricaulis sp. TaxID=1486257 RepID=UPI003299939E
MSSIRIYLLPVLLLAACGASPSGADSSPGTEAAAAGSSQTAEAAQPEPSQPEEQAVEAEQSAGPDVQAAASSDDEAPLRATPPPPGPDFPPPDENGVITINWDDLLPEGELERIEQLYNSAYATMEINHFGGQMQQIGTFNVEPALIGQTVRMPGFILPLDYQPGGEIDEFLLVPYFGACIHTPPPPPNQIVYVTLDEPLRVDRLWDPVWVTGELSSDRHMNGLGDAAYTMRLISHEPYRD